MEVSFTPWPLYTHQETPSCTHWIGDQMALRASLDSLGKRKSSCLCWELDCVSSGVQLWKCYPSFCMPGIFFKMFLILWVTFKPLFYYSVCVPVCAANEVFSKSQFSFLTCCICTHVCIFHCLSDSRVVCLMWECCSICSGESLVRHKFCQVQIHWNHSIQFIAILYVYIYMQKRTCKY